MFKWFSIYSTPSMKFRLVSSRRVCMDIACITVAITSMGTARIEHVCANSKKTIFNKTILQAFAKDINNSCSFESQLSKQEPIVRALICGCLLPEIGGSIRENTKLFNWLSPELSTTIQIKGIQLLLFPFSFFSAPKLCVSKSWWGFRPLFFRKPDNQP